MRKPVALKLPALFAAALLAFFGVTAAPRAATVAAVEFYHAGFNHYFMTTSVAEMALLDAGTTIKGWSRTSQEFKVSDTPGPGLVPVCRFFSASFGLKSSHFYTPLASECITVKGNPDWIFEAEAFYVPLPSSVGSCAAGMSPVYRLYNNGQGGAPNHAYTPFQGTRGNLLYQGWIPEGMGTAGVTFCVPSFVTLAQPRLQLLAGGSWNFTFTLAGFTTASATFGVPRITGDVELPYVSEIIVPANSGLVTWDPYAAKLVALLTVNENIALIFMFAFEGGDAIEGCVFAIDALAVVLGPCTPFSAVRV